MRRKEEKVKKVVAELVRMMNRITIIPIFKEKAAEVKVNSDGTFEAKIEFKDWVRKAASLIFGLSLKPTDIRGYTNGKKFFKLNFYCRGAKVERWIKKSMKRLPKLLGINVKYRYAFVLSLKA